MGERPPALLRVEDLRVEFRSAAGTVNAVNGASFEVARGETLAILGESGSGKSVTASVLMDILDSPPGRVTGGRAVFASGSPFDAVDFEGRTFIPGQGNNAYIFPGVGLGAIVSATRHVTDEMFAAAARTLADTVSDEDLRLGRIYPALERIRDVSARIAVAVAETAYERGLARQPRPADLLEAVRAHMFWPKYTPLNT